MVEIALTAPFLREIPQRDRNRYPLAASLLSGRVRGKAYAPSSENIRAAWLLGDQGWLYTFGETEELPLEEILAVASAYMEEKKRPIYWFGIPRELIAPVNRSGAVSCALNERYRFSFQQERFPAERTEESLLPIESIGPGSIAPLFEKYPDVRLFWQDEDQFMSRGFGKILRKGSDIVGYAISASLEDNRAEIDLEIDEDQRGKGFAKALSRSFIRECVLRGIRPRWDCLADNTPSVRTARSLGFEVSEKYCLAYLTSM